MHKLITIILASATVVNCDPATPICDKVCVCDDLRADCSRKSINIMPSVDMWPENVTQLDLHSNFIDKIDVEMSQDNLLSLDLSYNKIDFVNRSVFGGLKNLKYLDLSENLIEELDKQTFYGLEKLEVLNISHNLIKKLPQNVFYNLLDIEELVLSSNHFVFFEKAHFLQNINLKRLEVADIKAYILHFDVFHNSLNLEYLDLSKNMFPKVPAEALRSAKHLKWLQLDMNPIESLNQDSFRGLKNLEYLYIRFMPELRTVGPKTFSELINLQVLEMKSNNKLVDIADEAFDGLFNDSTYSLKNLDLEMNQLSRFNGGGIPCKTMYKFNLQRNPWKCDCNLKWLQDCNFKELYAADFKCDEPENLKNQLITSLIPEKFTCEDNVALMSELRHHNRVIRALSLAFTCIVMVTIGIIIIFVIKFKSIRTWYQKRRRGQGAVYYVRAKQFPTEYH